MLASFSGNWDFQPREQFLPGVGTPEARHSKVTEAFSSTALLTGPGSMLGGTRERQGETLLGECGLWLLQFHLPHASPQSSRRVLSCKALQVCPQALLMEQAQGQRAEGFDIHCSHTAPPMPSPTLPPPGTQPPGGATAHTQSRSWNPGSHGE